MTVTAVALIASWRTDRGHRSRQAPDAHPGARALDATGPRRLAIVGVTASGKSALALALAARLGGSELVSIDSMQVYRGMDIGTAKPGAAEQAQAWHHLIDLIDPHEECSVAWFRDRFDAVISDLDHRGPRRPFSWAEPACTSGRWWTASRCRGSGQRSQPSSTTTPTQRPSTGAWRHSTRPRAGRMEPTNRRRIVRALEVTIGSGRPFSSFGPGLETYPRTDVEIIGLTVDGADFLEPRIRRRLADGGGFPRRSRPHRGGREWLVTNGGSGARLPRTCSSTCATIGHSTPASRTRSPTPVASRFEQDRWFRRDPRITWFDADRADRPRRRRHHPLGTKAWAGRDALANVDHVAVDDHPGLRGPPPHQAPRLGQRLPRRAELDNPGLTIDAAVAVAVCDRRRGIGADGLLYGFVVADRLPTAPRPSTFAWCC